MLGIWSPRTHTKSSTAKGNSRKRVPPTPQKNKYERESETSKEERNNLPKYK
jgi:hypothetical protein